MERDFNEQDLPFVKVSANSVDVAEIAEGVPHIYENEQRVRVSHPKSASAIFVQCGTHLSTTVQPIRSLRGALAGQQGSETFMD